MEVSALGLGCATMTPFYGEPDPASAVDTIRRAHELGIDFLDTSDAYGNGRNEELISRVRQRTRATPACSAGHSGSDTKLQNEIKGQSGCCAKR